ncbi:MAG: YebC/PmpR family DNA-binding transcriptional regulator [Phycisphaerae bacterium]
MAGHSHWAKIKRAKASTDAKRGREWSKLARRIIVAAKEGGPNPDENLKLRYAIDDAKAANMPNDTIDRAIKKGSGELGSESYVEITYEGYGPGGVAFLVDCLTDNRNRTAPEMRKLFERAGGQLGETNCVAWMFEAKGIFVIPAETADEDTLMELALESGADDVTRDEDGDFEIRCQPSSFTAVKQALAEKGIETESAQVQKLPGNTIACDAETAAKVLKLEEGLEDHDDVQKVWANFEISDDVMAQMQ